MNPRVKNVVPMPNYMLNLTFADGANKQFDMKPYLTKGIFVELKDDKIFNTAHVSFGTVAWSNGADLCPDTFYEQSK